MTLPDGLVELYQQQIEFLSDFELIEWETEFMDRVEPQLCCTHSLSDGQVQELSEIYNKYRNR